MSWCNVIQRAGSNYCVNDNFPSTFFNFCLQILTQERISCFFWSMSVKSSTVRCLSNAVAKVFCNCYEKL